MTIEPAPLTLEPDGILVDHLTLTTPTGPLYFRRRTGTQLLEQMEIAEGLGIFFRYNRERQKETLLKVARLPYGDVTIVHTTGKVLAGYVSLHPVESGERWYSLNQPSDVNPTGQLYVHEFGAIEVSRHFRGLGLSARLLKAGITDDPWFEDKILVSVEFAWHWDYEETGMNKFVYRKMLRKVIASAGFEQMDTDEPNVMLDSANMFMVRIGPRVPSEIQQRFFSLLHKNNRWGL